MHCNDLHDSFLTRHTHFCTFRAGGRLLLSRGIERPPGRAVRGGQVLPRRHTGACDVSAGRLLPGGNEYEHGHCVSGRILLYESAGARVGQRARVPCFDFFLLCLYRGCTLFFFFFSLSSCTLNCTHSRFLLTQMLAHWFFRLVRRLESRAIAWSAGPEGTASFTIYPCPGGYYCPIRSFLGTTNKCPERYYCPDRTETFTLTPCVAGFYCA